MKELLGFVLMLAMVLTFVLVMFGVWSAWMLVAEIVAGFVYMIFTDQTP